MKVVLALLLVCAVLPAAMGYKWTSCGTRYDRLKTETLSFTVVPRLEGGAKATIHTTGATDLHVPLVSGAWQVRIYELGFAHAIDTAFGDLSTALKFTDPKNTTYEFTAEFTLPAAKGSQANFTASLTSTDQQHAVYNCLEVQYAFPTTTVEEEEEEEESTAVVEAPQHAVVPVTDAADYKWTSCGTRYDRLKTETLSFTVVPRLEGGAKATIHTTGATDLHVPLVSGAWQVRIYELGFAHAIDTAFGDLSTALKFTDPKNTTYEFTAEFTLPAAKGSQANFTASLTSTDQQHAVYNCLEVQYAFPTMTADVEEEVEAPQRTPSATRMVDGPHFESCGNSSDILKDVKISFTPSNPKAGDTVQISATGMSAKTISGGSLNYEAGFDGIPLIHKTKPLCDIVKQAHLACPIKAGPVSIDLSFKLPGFVPPGKYTATGKGYDQDGKPLLCLTGYFVLA